MPEFNMHLMFLPRLRATSRGFAEVEAARTAGIAGRMDIAEEERLEQMVDIAGEMTDIAGLVPPAGADSSVPCKWAIRQRQGYTT